MSTTDRKRYVTGDALAGALVGEDDVVQVRFAGSGDAFGSGGRVQACIHLTGAARRLRRNQPGRAQGARLDPNAVDGVAVTHLHGDHFGGLPFLILEGQFPHRSAPLLVAGPPGIRASLTEAMETLFPGSSQTRRRFEVNVAELATDGAPATLGAATVRGWEVVHACGAPPASAAGRPRRGELRILRGYAVDGRLDRCGA